MGKCLTLEVVEEEKEVDWKKKIIKERKLRIKMYTMIIAREIFKKNNSKKRRRKKPSIQYLQRRRQSLDKISENRHIILTNNYEFKKFKRIQVFSNNSEKDKCKILDEARYGIDVKPNMNGGYGRLKILKYMNNRRKSDLNKLVLNDIIIRQKR